MILPNLCFFNTEIRLIIPVCLMQSARLKSMKAISRIKENPSCEGYPSFANAHYRRYLSPNALVNLLIPLPIHFFWAIFAP